MKKTTIGLATLAGGCGGDKPATQEEEPVLTGEETAGELPEKEPARRDDQTTAR